MCSLGSVGIEVIYSERPWQGPPPINQGCLPVPSTWIVSFQQCFKKSFLKYDLVLFILESRKMGCHLGVAHYWVLAGLASLSLVILQDNALGL